MTLSERQCTSSPEQWNVPAPSQPRVLVEQGPGLVQEAGGTPQVPRLQIRQADLQEAMAAWLGPAVDPPGHLMPFEVQPGGLLEVQQLEVDAAGEIRRPGHPE